MIDPNQWIQGQEEVEKLPAKAAKSNELHKSKSMGSLLHDVSQVGLLRDDTYMIISLTLSEIF